MRKRILKIVGVLLVSLLSLLLLVIAYIKIALPAVAPAPDLTILQTPERLARGKYLALHVTGCIACHSTRDESKFSEPVMEETFGRGGEVFSIDAGQLVAPNISSFALHDWTDGEIFRALTTGVDRHGKPLFPLMPYQNFAKMDKEDIYSIIAYIRTLKPIQSTPAKSDLYFPMNIIVHTIPADVALGTKPDLSDTLQYGKYLLTAANCADCHSPMEKGKFIEGLAFSGGTPFKLANGTVVRSVNITFDKASGIGNWTKEMFIQRFKAALDSGYTRPVKQGDVQTVMPWTSYAHMHEQDLGAIYAYLKTIKPVSRAK